MSIKGLTKLFADNAPKAMKEQQFDSYFGRKIAIDASMSIYKFLIVVGRSGTEMLTNEAGEVTSHLQGMFSRTIRLLEAGLKPVLSYVFDGKPPELKKQELAKRYSKRADATEDLNQAIETGNKEEIEKFSKQTVKVTKQHNEDCKRLLRLMGVPVIEAPSEAEAQCAALCKSGRDCNSLRTLEKIHAQVITNGCQNIPSISNKLLKLYVVSSGSLAYAQLLFHHIQNPQTQAWNSIIRAFSQSPNPIQAIIYYNHMVLYSHSRPNNVTFSFLLKACEIINAKTKCKEVHGSIIRTGYQSDIVVGTNLIRSYAANGLIDVAQMLFDGMSEKDLVSWNSMISCYSQAGLHYEALKIYDQMRNLNVGFDGFSLVSLLSSCAHVGALSIGARMHELACQMGLLENVFVGNALIDMYAKCGSLDRALSVFNGMQKRDVLTWNSMIIGYGVHGYGDEAICFFRKMLMVGLEPDSVTFLGLLCGCSHQGLVQVGVEYFRMMSSRFNLKPDVKHYGCVVDLFGRAGKLGKAVETIEGSPFRDNPILWRTLLGSCKIHGDLEKGEIAMRNLFQLGTLNAGDCILLAGIYSEANDLQGVTRMRKMIRTEGIKTTQGWSWIEVGGQIHRFVVDDKSHTNSKEIYLKLEDMMHLATSAYYARDSTTEMLEPTSEICWENFAYHSEKLAIAFGLVRTPEGTLLQIVKNLRVCRDCHSFTKFVSKAYNRKIIVRDRVRFHHFKDGLCSCADYW